MRFDGVVSDFYNGGFRIAKGFLKLSEIVKFKVYDNIEDSEFQRKADISHVDFLIDYLNNKPYKILPDIIFSMKTDYPNSSLIEEKRYLINDKTIWNLEIMEPRYNAQKENGLKTITIWIQDNAYDFIDTIDGNHRLKALQKIYNEKLDSSPNLEDYKIPVTFILNNTKNKEKAFFYYLNSKSKPLLPNHYINLLNNTEEHELGQIDYELKLYKKIYELLNSKLDLMKGIPFIDKKDRFNSGLMKIAHELSRDSIDHKFDELILNQLPYFCDFALREFELIDEIIHILFISIKIYFGEIKQNKNQFQEITDSLNGNYEKLKEIIEANQLSEENNNNIIRNTIIKIDNDIKGLKEWKIKQKIDFSDSSEETYENINSFYKAYKIYKKTFIPSSRKIFVAMPFDKQTEATYFLIKEVIYELNNDESFIYDNLELVRIDKEIYPTSDFINETIMNEIDNADLMIADLTGHNRNVYYEVGYKAGIDKHLDKRRIIVINDTSNLYCDDDRKNEKERLMDLQNEVKSNFGQNSSVNTLKIKVKEVNSLETAFDIYTLAQIRFKDYGYLKDKLKAKLRKYYTT